MRLGPRVLEIHPLQELHGVVEGAVGRHAEIEQLDGVGRAQARGHLRLAQEALHHRVALLHRPLERLGQDQLHGRGSRQQQVPRLPHFPHAAELEALLELVAADRARGGDLLVGAAHRARRDRGDGDRDSRGRERAPVVGGGHRDRTPGREQPQAAGHGQPAQDRNQQRGARRRRDQQREQDDDRDHPGQRGHVPGAEEAGPGDRDRNQRHEQQLRRERDADREPIRDRAGDRDPEQQHGDRKSRNIVRDVDRALEPGDGGQRAQQQGQEGPVGERSQQGGDAHATAGLAPHRARQVEGHGVVGPQSGEKPCGHESRHAAFLRGTRGPAVRVAGPSWGRRHPTGRILYAPPSPFGRPIPQLSR